MSQIIQIDEKQNGMSIEKWLKNNYPKLSHAGRHKLLRTGQIRLNGGRVKPSIRLTKGDLLRLPPILILQNNRTDIKKDNSSSNKKNAPISKADIEFIRSCVLYQDDHIIALNKPSGIAVQGGTKTTKHIDALLEALTSKNISSEKPRITHRLDRDTSGVLLLARSQKIAALITQLFRQRKIEKTYCAITVGVPNPPSGEINLALVKAGKKERSHIADQKRKNAKNATTLYQTKEKVGKKFAVLSLYPKTGRNHQLRAHMAAIGTPILGDGKYGGKKAHPNTQLAKKLHLHAISIKFTHPYSGENIAIHAPLSPHMLETMHFLEIPPEDEK